MCLRNLNIFSILTVANDTHLVLFKYLIVSFKALIFLLKLFHFALLLNSGLSFLIPIFISFIFLSFYDPYSVSLLRQLQI